MGHRNAPQWGEPGWHRWGHDLQRDGTSWGSGPRAVEEPGSSGLVSMCGGEKALCVDEEGESDE